MNSAHTVRQCLQLAVCPPIGCVRALRRPRVGMGAVRCAGRSLLPMVMGLMLAGCWAVGPNFQKPGAPVAKEWIEQQDSRLRSGSGDYSQWWKAFDDPVLNSLIELACQQNPSLQIAGIRILEARAQLGVAVGNLFPQKQQLTAAHTYNQTSQNAPNTAGTSQLIYQTYSVGLTAAWELDLWGKYRRSVESADASLIASVASYDDALVSLLGDVATNYVLIRIYQERLLVARENVEIQKQSLKLTDARFRNGAVTELDVQQAKSLLYSTESKIPTLETGLRQAQNALSILLGIAPRDLEDLIGGVKPIPKAPVEVVIGIPAELLLRRPDVRYAELQAAAQCAQIGVAKADLFPRISLSGSFGFSSSDSYLTRKGWSTFADMFSWKSFVMSSGPSIEWPILNYGRITNNIRIQDARFQEALVTYQKTVLTAAREAEDALVSFLQAQDQVGFLTQSVQAAKRAVDLSLIQYREGAVDYTRVLNAQQSLVEQQDLLVQSRGAIPTNLVSLYKALGGGWQVRLGQEFVSEETLRAMRSRTNWGSLLPPRDYPRELEPPRPAGDRFPIQKPDW
ncbi:MAG TPA: transporter [Syntrophobacteraceae bacterium]|nr:transporter [Syntrophobacteraceae bacterium]